MGIRFYDLVVDFVENSHFGLKTVEEQVSIMIGLCER